MTTELLKYIKTIINDEYAMEVLFYSIKQTMLENKFSLQNINCIKISNKFLPIDVSVNIHGQYSSQLESFAIVLSIRALMLHKEWIADCDRNNLLFNTVPTNNFWWIEYVSHIMDCMSDKSFSELFSMMQSIFYGGNLSIENEQKFKDSIVTPEYRNLTGYYKSLASTKPPRSQASPSKKSTQNNEVIPNNAYVCDNTIQKYVITNPITYVGNTAFAYCENLTSIVIRNPHILFGKFPIIECPKLTSILVPKGSESYYQEALPYYKDIISAE